MQFQNITIPTLSKVTGNSEGEGDSKAKMFEGKYEAKLAFPGRQGGSNQKPSMRGMDIFLNCTFNIIFFFLSWGL